MSVRVHPRFRERRTKVGEHRARRHLRRMLVLLGIVAAATGIIWLAQSPLFSVATVRIEGDGQAAVDAILTESHVYEGRPLLLINTGKVESALEADPWVKTASVSRRFPTTIDVEVVERFEVATLAVGTSWVTLSDDGHVMRQLDARPDGLAAIQADVAPEALQTALTGTEVLAAQSVVGAAEFLAALPSELWSAALVVTTGEELTGTVAGHPVRLGAPVDTFAKGVALVAVLQDGQLGEGEIVDLIAPTRPAVRKPAAPPRPEPPPEPEATDVSD